jgi:hypothetical protein
MLDSEINDIRKEEKLLQQQKELIEIINNEKYFTDILQIHKKIQDSENIEIKIQDIHNQNDDEENVYTHTIKKETYETKEPNETKVEEVGINSNDITLTEDSKDN